MLPSRLAQIAAAAVTFFLTSPLHSQPAPPQWDAHWLNGVWCFQNELDQYTFMSPNQVSLRSSIDSGSSIWTIQFQGNFFTITLKNDPSVTETYQILNNDTYRLQYASKPGMTTGPFVRSKTGQCP